MGNIFTNYAVNSILRSLVSIVAQAIATYLALDAAQTASLSAWLAAGAAQAVVFGPILWNQITRPSQAAMKVADQADKIIAGDKAIATVQTPSDAPNIVVKAENQNIGHS